jgi:hypothetical protein
MFLGKNKNQE